MGRRSRSLQEFEESPEGARESSRYDRLRQLASDALRLRAYLAEGLDDEEIALETGWDSERIRALREKVLRDEELRVIGMRSEEVWTRFVLSSERNTRRCDELFDDFRRAGTEQVTGLVGLLKVQQSILGEVLKRGQDMGFIRRDPTKHVHVLADMSDPQVRDFLSEKIGAMRAMMLRHGGHDLLSLTEADTTEAVLISPATETRPGVVRVRDMPEPVVIRRRAVAVPPRTGAEGG